MIVEKHSNDIKYADRDTQALSLLFCDIIVTGNGMLDLTKPAGV